MLKKLFILFICLVFLIIPCSAKINVNMTDYGTTFIVWSWNTSFPLINITIDGINTCFFNPNDTSFSLTDLNPDEVHFIEIQTSNDTGYNYTKTKPFQSNQESFFGKILPYIIGGIVLVLIFVGIFVDFVGFIGSIIALSQMVIYANEGNFILGIIWFILVMAGILTCKSVGLLQD